MGQTNQIQELIGITALMQETNKLVRFRISSKIC